MPSHRRSQRDRATAVPDPEPRGYTNGLHFSAIGRSLDGKINGIGRSNGLRAAGATNGGRTNGRTNGRVNGRTNGRINGRINGRTNGRINGRINGRVNGRINGGQDGAVNGLTNGRQIGLVNGRRSNGLTNGITNGLVNGKGAVNGFRLSYQHRRVHFQKRGGLAKKLIVLFLVVGLIVIVPQVLVYTIPQSSVKIDGYFLDWHQAHLYREWPDSQNPDVAIQTYAVQRDSVSTYFYVRTQGEILRGADGGADGFYIFIDIDSRPSTGYSTHGLGADAMIAVVGWNNSVMESGAFVFSSRADATDFHGFHFRSVASVAFRDDEMELSCDIGIRSDSKVAIVGRHTGVTDDWSDVNFQPSGAALNIEEMFDAEEVVQSGIEQHFLTVRISDEGTAAFVTGLNLSFLGNATPIQIVAYDGLSRMAISSSPELVFAEPIRISDRTTLEIDVRAVVANGSSGSTFGLALSRTKPVASTEHVSWRITTSQEGARIAYLDNPPSRIAIDGAFGDWASRVPFLDRLGDMFSSKPLSDNGSGDIDISGVKVSSAPDTAYFYMAVNGTMLGGSSVPRDLVRYVRPEGPAQNITNVSEPLYGSDFAMVFIDTDLNQSSGYEVGGSEAAIAVIGKDNQILSSYAYAYSGGQWAQVGPVEAAVDQYQLEIGAAYSLLGLAPGTTYPMTFATEDWRSNQDDISIAFTARTSAGTRAYGGIILNEILNQQKPSNADWVEIYNTGTVPISITGYTLYADGVLVYTFPSITLQPGELYVTPMTLEFNKASTYQLFDASHVEIDQTTSKAWQEKTWGRTGPAPFSQWTNMKPTPGALNVGQVIPEFSEILAVVAIVPIMLIAIRRMSSRRNPPVGEHQNGR